MEWTVQGGDSQATDLFGPTHPTLVEEVPSSTLTLTPNTST